MTKTIAALQNAKPLYGLLGVSLLFFLIKGVKYAWIGSYVPLLFVSAIIALLAWSITSSASNHYRIMRFWAILIIIWALARLSLWLILQIDQNLTESHLREQFGLFQHIISLFMLGIGVFTIRQIKRQKMGLVETKQ